MENQHRKITGYRELDESEIYSMNQAKEMASCVGDVIEKLETSAGVDKRWLAIAKTDLQKGFMSLVRAIAKPTTF